MLSSDFFIGNRKRLQGSIEKDTPVAIFAHGVMQMSRDTGYRFEQDRNFFYLTGIDLPGWILVMNNNEEYLIAPERSRAEEIFDGEHNLELAKKVSGVSKVVDHEAGLKSLKKHNNIASNVDSKKLQFGLVSNSAASEYMRKNGLKSDEITLEILKLRTIKQEAEIAEVKKAISITKRGFEAARKELDSVKNEADIQAVFDESFTRDHSEHAYTPIVAAGKNACTLHYISNRGSLEGQGLLLLDIGARSNYYAADVTRTWELEGAKKRQIEVSEATMKAFDEIIKHIKPGLRFKDYQQHVDEVMASALSSLGIEHDEDGLRKYFPHSPSHGLGLDVHDPIAGYEEMQAGMVLTLEPGIYIPEEGIGARYEDDLLITKDGVENLSETIK